VSKVTVATLLLPVIAASVVGLAVPTTLSFVVVW
jgi:hypothetical protein